MNHWSSIFLAAVLLCARGASSAEPSPIDLLLNPPAFSSELTQQSVGQSFQDSRGVLWLVTQEGLNKYTGHELENYRFSSADPNSLPSNIVTRIAEDSRGTIWLATIGGGLARYNPIKNDFTAFKADPNNRNTPYSNDIHTLFVDGAGTIWLGYNNGFSTFDPLTLEFHHHISGNNDLPYMGIVSSFSATSDGTIWAASENYGLLQIEPNTRSIKTHVNKPGDTTSIVPGRLYHLTTDRFDTIWISSAESGVSRFNPKTQTAVNYVHAPDDNRSISSNNVFDVYEDFDGDIWVATAEGLNLFDQDTGTFDRYSTHNTNLPEDATISVYQTREGMYWIGTLTGLAAGIKTRFKKFDRSSGGLSGESVNVFIESEDGSLWVGTDDGLNRLRPDTDTFEWINESTEPSISSATVMSLYSEGEILWVGTFDSGLNKIDLDSNEVEVFRHSPLNDQSIPANGITSIQRTSNGDLLVGTYGGGLAIFDDVEGTFTTLNNRLGDDTSLSSNMVLAILEDSFGYVWIGTEDGLNRFETSTNSFQRFSIDANNSTGLSSNIVWSFFEDTERHLWLGTGGGGLIKWPAIDREGLEPMFLHLSNSLKLPSASIYGIQQDETGWIWVSHNKGLTRFNPSSFESHQYGLQDGLQAAEFNLGASYTSKEGVLFFGGIAGFNSIKPSQVSLERVPPKVSISQIKVMNERREFDSPYNSLDSIDLSYQDRMLSVEFFAADYSSPQLLNYAYKLEGINPDWVISPDSRVASFTTLPPGDYTLKLAAASPDGTWNWDGFSVPVRVAPPPWRSPYAYAIYAVFAAVIVAYYFYRQRRNAQLAQEVQRELELRVEERTRDLEDARKVAEEATKAKSDFLATMSHEIRTPMHGIIGMTELLLHTNLSNQQQQFASAAHKSGESLLTLINEILDFSKAEASKVEVELVDFSIVELIDDICYLQGEPAARKGLDLRNVCNPRTPDRLIGDPTKIRQVVMNLVSNAIKFTHDGSVTVSVDAKFSLNATDEFLLQIEVADDGIGMDDETQRRVFEPFTQADTSTTREYGGTGLGLSISKHYIELMGGSISIHSVPGNGTTIQITIPAKVSENNAAPQLEFSDISAAVLTDDSATFDMVSSHLARFGINAHRLDLVRFQSERTWQDAILVVDYCPGAIASPIIGVFQNIEVELPIVLTPINTEIPTDLYVGWRQLSKPVTSAALSELLKDHFLDKARDDDTQFGVPTTDTESRDSVLVAEDLETNQQIVKEMLQLLGYRVDIATNGELALAKYKNGQYVAVFMDCQMPVLDGYEATKAIRTHEKNNGLSRTPIIALTAGANEEDEEKCIESGMDGYIKKPFSISDIESNLRLVKDLNESPSLSESTCAPVSVGVKKNAIGEETDIFNMSAIDSIKDVERQTGKSILPDIFHGYTEQMSQKMIELRDAASKQDCVAVYRAAHAIKSMSANIGAEKVRSISAMIESQGRDRNLESLFESLYEAELAYSEFVTEFESTFAD